MKKILTAILLSIFLQTMLIGAQVGDTVSLKGYKLIPQSDPVAIVAVKPEIIDSIVGEMEKNSLPGLFYFVKEEKATMLPDGTRVKVLEFSKTPKRKMSCAHVQIMEGDLKGFKVWTLLNQD